MKTCEKRTQYECTRNICGCTSLQGVFLVRLFVCVGAASCIIMAVQDGDGGGSWVVCLHV